VAEIWIEPEGVMPVAGVLQAVYTVPDDKALMWNLHVCPQGGATTFTVERGFEGEARDDKHRVFYAEPVERAYQAVVGFTATAGTEIRVSSANGRVSFQLSGILRDQA